PYNTLRGNRQKYRKSIAARGIESYLLYIGDLVGVRRLFFGGRLELAQRRHGGRRGVFAIAVFGPSFGLGGVMILRHVVSCFDWRLGTLP
ncbi:MAG: hypothetical protein WAM98_21685, partial [Terriglobales bacterium]